MNLLHAVPKELPGRHLKIAQMLIITRKLLIMFVYIKVLRLKEFKYGKHQAKDITRKRIN